MVGRTLSHFRITAELGAGGMGEVYRAEDTRLDREVAIKVLPAALAADPERLARFEREAKLLAALSHPHIAGIHEVGEAEGRPFLVMELAPGETLAERIARGPLPVEEACAVGLQIADALAAAHERGIVHRDLKPANVKVDAADRVKVLDFGLAKALEPEPEGEVADATHSPTLSLQATRAGLILGTAAYMSPEQARGRPADRRSDLWSLGVLLWELLTGRRLFEGETVSDTLAAVLRAEPEWSQLPASTSPPLRRLLRRCLERDPAHRLADAGDAGLELRDALAGGEGEPSGATSKRRTALPWAIATALALAVVALLTLRPDGTPAVEGPRFFELDPPDGATYLVEDGPVTLSPDGRRLALIVERGPGERLAIRYLDEPEFHFLSTGTSTYDPFWSPDGRRLGFFAGDNLLKTIDPAGGPPSTLARASDGRGATWNEAGDILFTPEGDGPVYHVRASGGAAEPVTVLNAERGETGHWRPWFLPGGRRFLYLAAGPAATPGADRDAAVARGRGLEVGLPLWVGSLDGEAPVQVPGSFSGAVKYAAPGYLLWVNERALMARRFDSERLGWRGEPVVLAPSVDLFPEWGTPAFSVARGGILAYHEQSPLPEAKLVVRDRQGTLLSELSVSEGPENLDLAPDGRRAALERTDLSRNQDIWTVDLERGTLQRLTVDETADLGPVWSPDGRRIVYTRRETGRDRVIVRSAAGFGDEVTILEADGFPEVVDWSPDGELLLLEGITTDGGLWVAPAEGGRDPTPFVTSPAYFADSGRFSPDGRWIAYVSNETGRREIYLRPFPSGEGKWQISTSGGDSPRWRADGGEIFYWQPDGHLMAVTMEGARDDRSPRFTLPIPLLAAVGPTFEPFPDGQRFLLIEELGEAVPAPITIVLNWPALLERRD